MHRSSAPVDLGELGERVAARHLERSGYRVVARNVRVGHDEIDLIVEGEGQRIAVEVKCAANGDDPLLAVDDAKLARTWRAAASIGRIARIDLVGVSITPHGVEVRWLQGVS